MRYGCPGMVIYAMHEVVEVVRRRMKFGKRERSEREGRNAGERENLNRLGRIRIQVSSNFYANCAVFGQLANDACLSFRRPKIFDTVGL